MEGETNSAVRQLARRLPSFVAERPGPAVVDRVSQDAIRLDAPKDVLDVGPSAEEGLRACACVGP